MADATTPLMFEPPCSAPDGGFWREAARVKLHEAKLDETPIDVRARVCCAQNAEVSSAVSLDALAFDDATSEGEEAAGGRGTWTTRGQLTCANTREALATFDRDGAMRAMGREMLESVMNGDAEREPERLRAFAVVAYACLKSWSFTYWFAFPALASAEFKIMSSAVTGMTNEGVDGDIAATCERWIASGGASAWLVSEDGREAYALTEYEARTRAGAKPRLAFADACCAMTHPGWTLRNLAVLASARWGASALDVVCVRARKGRVLSLIHI